MKHRQSNIEFLRILAMLMIIDIHYFACCNASLNVSSKSGNWFIYIIMESLGICGVNLFVLITGFFSQKTSRIRIRKIANILLDVAFWGVLGFLLNVLIGWKGFDIKELIKSAIPIFFGKRWFVQAYIVLLCLIPFINSTLEMLSKSSYKRLLIILGLLFCIWPSFLPNPPLDDYGYSFVHFIVLYIIAGYIRIHIKTYPPRWLCLMGYFISMAIVCISSFYGNAYSWAYNYVFVISEAVCLFLFFIQIEIRSQNINKIAACTFGIFLIHTDGFFSAVVYDRILHCNELVDGSPILFLISVLVSMPLFIFIGYILETMKKKLFALSIDSWLDKIQIINRIIDIKQNKYEES